MSNEIQLRKWLHIEKNKRRNYKKTKEENWIKQEKNCNKQQVDEIDKKRRWKHTHQRSITNSNNRSSSETSNPEMASNIQRCRCPTHINRCSRRCRLISPPCGRRFDFFHCAGRKQNKAEGELQEHGKKREKRIGQSMNINTEKLLLLPEIYGIVNSHTNIDGPAQSPVLRGRCNEKYERTHSAVQSFNNSNASYAYDRKRSGNQSNRRKHTKHRSKSRRHRSRGGRNRSKSRRHRSRGGKSRSKSRRHKSRRGRSRSKSRRHKSRRGRSRSKSRRHKSRRGGRSRSKSRRHKSGKKRGRRHRSKSSKHRKKRSRHRDQRKHKKERKHTSRSEEERLSDNALDIFKTMIEKMPKSQKKLFAHYFHARRPDAWNDLLKVVTGLMADKHMQKLESRADYMKSFTASRPEYFRRLNNLEEATDGLSKLVDFTWSELEKEVDFCVNLETCHDDASMLKWARQTLGSDWLLSKEVMNNLSHYFTSEMPFEWNEEDFNRMVHDKMLSSVVSEAL